ncbi:MAG: hypothetical protein KGK30_02250 [Elusimicrobia bacterium]|nr:hypothetical protein [Elusimicrobiota bacterium]
MTAGEGLAARAPYRFCREIEQASGHGIMAVQYLAAALDLKPLLDDWVEPGRLEDFRRACRRYGLKVLPDVRFLNVRLEDVPRDVVGRDRLTSTVAYAAPLGGREGQIHVYVSRHARLLRHGMWYPLIVKGRVIHTPYTDTLRYGELLGYPDCCVRFFARKNNWSRYSYLYEAFKNTQGHAHRLCNPFLKDTCYSYIYHMPCSYRCRATISAAGGLRARLNRLEPALVKEIDAAASGPFLVLYERDFLGFDGRLRGDELEYNDVFRLQPWSGPDPLLEALRRGSRVRLKGRRLEIGRGAVTLRRLRLPLEDWAPRFPFIIEFGRG